jgi:hypothetical protein
MTPFIVLSQRLYSVRTEKLYKKEIVSIIEEYSWVSYDVIEVMGGQLLYKTQLSEWVDCLFYVLALCLVAINTWNFVSFSHSSTA